LEPSSSKKPVGDQVPYPLTEANIQFARSIAKSLHGNLPQHIELEDLIGSALLGLVRAALNYRAESRVPFQAFARHKVRGEILDSLRRKNFDHNYRTKQLSANPELIQSLRYQADQEIELDRKKVNRELKRALGRLGRNHERVLKLRFLEEKTGKQTSQVPGFTEARISQLGKEGVQELRKSRELKSLMGVQSIESKSEARATVDELGEVQKRLAEARRMVKAEEANQEAIQERILSWLPSDFGAAQEKTFHGNKFKAQVSAQQNKRTITSMEKVFGWMGKKTFLEKCSMTLKVLEVMLTGPQLMEVVSESRTGPRSISTEPLDKAEVKKAA